MNTLSTLIYAADVANDLNSVCGFIFYGGLICLPIYALCKGAARALNDTGYSENEPVTPSIAKVGKALLLPVILAGLVGVIVPSKSTILRPGGLRTRRRDSEFHHRWQGHAGAQRLAG